MKRSEVICVLAFSGASPTTAPKLGIEVSAKLVLRARELQMMEFRQRTKNTPPIWRL